MGKLLREGIVPREYQKAISQSALSRGNTLVVLPTGMGKTLAAFLVMEGMLGRGRMVFLAPTKPLVQQHCRTFLQMTVFPEEKAALITGEISPKNRAELWKREACFSTPQSFQNDIKAGRTSAACALCVIDEAHRAVGSYAYTFVAEQCSREGALLLGLTASPGGDRKRIQGIVDALGVQNIEIRTAEDPDVAPYIQKLETQYVRVPLGKAFSDVRRLLQAMLEQNAKYLEGFGMRVPLRSKKGLVELRGRILRMSERVRYSALSFYSSVFNLVHMLELIETQGMATFLAYVEKLRAREDTKAKRRIFSDPRFSEALLLCASASEHPKLAELIRILKERKGEKVLVFAQYRKQVETIVEALRNEGFSAERFLGKKEGVTAEEQKKTIERFSLGEFDVMAATSIGEEGLDIPSVDTVVFFEPIPSEIRSIQRRGRAGRLRAGKVVVLITENTRDEAYFHSSRKREENMKRIVGKMQRQFSHAKGGGGPQGAQDKLRSPKAQSSQQEVRGRQMGEKKQVQARPNSVSVPAAQEQKKQAKKKGAVQKRITDF